MTVLAETIGTGMPDYCKRFVGADLVDAATNAAYDIQDFIAFFFGKLSTFEFLITDEEGDEVVIEAHWDGMYLYAEVA